jgi:translation initiation factor 1
MSKKKKKHVVYSTNPDFEFDYEGDEVEETLDPEDQLLYVSIDRKNRGGKEVTLIEGFVGDSQDLKELAKLLKSSCGVGGSAKDGEILIQGNFRDKICSILEKEGYRYKKKGG